MKVVILAGGLGTRISEESHLKPKPMITIGDQPILWHIMKYYSSFGFHDFIICCGYKSHVIKEYFADYYLYRSDVTFDFSTENEMTVHQNVAEPWRVTLVDTGLNTQTGGRIARVRKYIREDRDPDRRPARRAVRCAGPGRDRSDGDRVPGESQGGRRLDQRRLYGDGAGLLQLSEYG